VLADVIVLGGIEEIGLKTAPLKLGQVPLLRCSDAVLEGFEAENKALQRPQRNFTALATPVS
jgi:hypothetical protein